MIRAREISAILTAYFLIFSTMVAPEIASGASRAAAARPSVPQNQAGTDPALDLRCDQLADSPDDPTRVGNGVPADQINVAAALSACQLAAAQGNPRAKYQFLVGRVLDAAHRYDEAIKWYSAADRGGYALASFNLGQLNEEGAGTPQNYAEAARLYARAAAGGSSWALIYLGNLYERGLGVTQDPQQAVNSYFKAGEAGNVEGYAELAAFYSRYNPPDYAKEVQWAQKAVQGGSAYGNLLLGYLYQFGKGVSKDVAQAIKYYMAAANGGDADSMYRLGLMDENGEGVRQDFSGAAAWFYKAAQLGHPAAQAELGYLCYSGQGVTKNFQAAYSWFLPAAQAGNRVAQSALGTMFESGQGIAQSDTDAVAWFRKAAEQGDIFSMDRLALHLRLGVGVAWNEAEATQWFTKAAQAGYAPSESALGYGYMQGLGGGAQDYNQAASWLTKAAKQGDGYAMLNLGVLYENGWGVAQDFDEARKLYLNASDSPDQQVATLASKSAAELAMEHHPFLPGSNSSSSSDKTPNWVPAVAIGIGVVALISLFSGSEHDGSGSVPSGSSGGGLMNSDNGGWPTASKPAPRTPVCHTVPDAIGSMTPNGLDQSFPTHGGGSTHLECN
jgi:TPR repeat protein